MQALVKDVDELKMFKTKAITIFQKATGLNSEDVNTAVTSPRKIQYLEETVRAMEEGSLKIRVRSLENEQALNRMAIQSNNMQALLGASLLLNAGVALPFLVPSVACYLGAGACAAKAAGGFLSLKVFDKKQARFLQKSFIDEEEEEEALADAPQGGDK